MSAQGDGNYKYDVLTKISRFPVKATLVFLLMTKTRLTSPTLVDDLSVVPLSFYKQSQNRNL